MSLSSDELYQKILKLRAQRLGVSPEEAERVDRSKPLFLLAAEAAAKRLGISPEEVLADDLQRMETSPYPTPECLTPDEVEDLVEAGAEPGALEVQVAVTAQSTAGMLPLPEVRLAHLRSCDACRTLVAASRPEQWRREEFRRFLDEELPRVAAAEGDAAGPPSAQAPQQSEQAASPATAGRRFVMPTKLYVGNLSFQATEDDLRELFAQAGTVESVRIVTDQFTGRPRGFGFVEMSTKEEAAKAVEMLNGRLFRDRNLVLDEARVAGSSGRRTRSA